MNIQEKYKYRKKGKTLMRKEIDLLVLHKMCRRKSRGNRTIQPPTKERPKNKAAKEEGNFCP